MGYPNCLPLRLMKRIGLFDDIPYKYVKNYIYKDPEYDFEVKITDIDNELGPNMCTTEFEFELDHKTFKVVEEYNTGSEMMLFMINLGEDFDEDEDEVEVEQ